MTTETTTPTPFEIPFFEIPPTLCKVYNDGGHFVAVPYFPDERRRKERKKPQADTAREMFDSLHAQAVTDGKTRAETRAFIRDNLAHLFDSDNALDDFIAAEMKRTIHNLHSRKNRFYRKANLNKWHYFVTFTYDDEKHSETSFRIKLRKCLYNLHTRHGWKYMGVFERAPETGRLHFHGLLYVPDGEMVGKITEKQDYSTKTHQMQTRHENDFFADAFGRNDFARINATELKHGDTIAYILKYIEKSGERITYSRGIVTEICKEITGDDIAAEMLGQFVLKWVLFDDVIEWERDIMHFKYEQMTFADISPHWLC